MNTAGLGQQRERNEMTARSRYTPQYSASQDLDSGQPSGGPGQIWRSKPQRKIRRLTNSPYVLVIVTGLVLLGLWELLSVWQPLFFASAQDTFRELGSLAATSAFWDDVRATVEEIAIGTALSIGFGGVCGVALAYLPRLDVATRPFIDIANTMPRMGLAPLFVLWFGLGISSRVALVFSVLFFVVLINVYSGIKSVDAELMLVVRVLGGTRRDVIIKVVFPSFMPWIVATLRMIAAYGLASAVIGEFVSGNIGLGYLLNYSTQVLNVKAEFASLAALGILALIMTVAIMIYERRALRWKNPREIGAPGDGR
jgi:NitT/TauT family transport system permease protein